MREAGQERAGHEQASEDEQGDVEGRSRREDHGR